MSDDIAVLGIKVESGQVDKAKRSLADLAAQGAKTEASIASLGQVYDRQGRLITASTIRQTKAFEDNNRALKQQKVSLESAIGGVKGLIGAYAGLVGARAIGGAIDEFTKFNAQLKLATRSQQEFAQAIGDVNRIANISQSSISSIGTLYARLNNALRDVGTSQEVVGKVTENVALALKISGATASETSSAILQLSQAFGSGVLRGEEFNAVNEAAPALMRALAESMGVPIGALRELASNGQITSDVLTKAFGNDNLLNKFREQSKEVNTLSGSFKVFTNGLLNTIGAIDSTLGASKALSKGLVFLGENAGVVVSIAGALAAALLAISAPAIIAGLTAIVALFTGPVGIVALFIGAAAAAIAFGNDSETAYGKAKKAAKDFNDEQARTKGAPKGGVSPEVQEYNDIIAGRKKLKAEEKKLNNQIKGVGILPGGEGSSILPGGQAKVSDLKKELKIVQGALKIIEDDFDKAYLKFSLQGRVTGNKTPGNKAISATGVIAPIFAAPEAQDINKIHDQQEAAARRLAEKLSGITTSSNSKKKKNKDEEEAAEKASLIKRLGARELELTTETRKFESLLDGIKETDKAKEKAYKADLKRIDALQDIANDNFKEAQKDFADAEKEKLREFEKTVDGIDQVFREGFANLVNGGKGSWKAFTKSLFTTFKTTVADQVYKLFAQPFIIKIAASIAGVGVSGAAGASGLFDQITGGAAGEGGLGGIFSTIKSFFGGGNASIIGGIESLGANISNGLGGIRDTIGGFLGQNASLVANVGAFSGAALSLLKGDIKGAAFQGGGAAIGLALGGPIGGAIGSFLGGSLGSLFGGKKQPPRTGATGTASFNNGVLTSGQGKANGRSTFSAAFGSPLEQVSGAFAQTLGTLFKSFGLGSNVSASTAFKGRDGGSGYGNFIANANGVTTNVDEKFKGAFGEASFNTFINKVLGEGIVKAIKNSSLTQGIKNLFDGLADKTVIASLVLATTSLNAQEVQLNKQFGLTVDVAARVVKASGAAGQGLADFANKIALVAQSSQSVGDVLVSSRANLSKSLGEVYGDIVSDAVTQTVTRQVAIAGNAKLPNVNGLFGSSQGGGLFALLGKAVPQQFKTVTEQVTTFVDRLVAKTVALPKSLEDYDALIKSINTSSVGGQKQAADLLNLRDAFGAYSQAIDGLKANVKGATFDLRDPETQAKLKQDELDGAFKKLGILTPKSTQEFLALADSIDFTTKFGLDLAASLPNLATAFIDINKPLDNLINTLERGADSFTNQVDASRYFGISQNFGTQFANDYTGNVEGGRIKNGVAEGTNNRDAELIAEIKALRQAVEVQAIDTSKLVRYQSKIDEIGLKVAS